MSVQYPTLTQAWVPAAALKILLWPAYKSTDFEVHRNWLAITHSLPLRKWYYESTSEWTLDYPPFFAYFEWLLSCFARVVNPAILTLQKLPLDERRLIYFQRATVIATELILLYALSTYVRSASKQGQTRCNVIALSILLSPGLLIIDHIHFQYNGLLYGILLLSISYARHERNILASGLVFAALLFMKHIYLYLAPAYFVYLLRAYCLSSRSMFVVQTGNCIKLGLGIAIIAAAALGPFAYWNQLPQLLARLFPFSRGLCHAYWAPNVWALYSLLDRIMIKVAPRLGWSVNMDVVDSVTRGLVGDTAFAVLPEITPRTTFVLTLASQIPPLIKLFFAPTWNNFVGALTLCGFASFLFGWHVHEKAILLVVIPFSLLALKDWQHLAAFRLLAIAGHVSLFPLLFTAQEFPIKTIYTAAWLTIFLLAFNRLVPATTGTRRVYLDRLTSFYGICAVPTIVYSSVIHRVLFQTRYEFMPLMLISTYSSIGVIASWLGYLSVYFNV